MIPSLQSKSPVHNALSHNSLLQSCYDTIFIMLYKNTTDVAFSDKPVAHIEGCDTTVSTSSSWMVTEDGSFSLTELQVGAVTRIQILTPLHRTSHGWL